MHKKSPWLYPYFYSCLIALLTSLQLENTLVMGVNTDCKALQFFIFMDLKMVQSSAEFMNTTFLVHSTYNFFLFLFSLLHRGDFWNIFVSNFFLQCCFMFSFFLYYVLILTVWVKILTIWTIFYCCSTTHDSFWDFLLVLSIHAICTMNIMLNIAQKCIEGIVFYSDIYLKVFASN